jgi:hypothetical protein
MPTSYLKLPYVDTVLRPESLQPIVLDKGAVGYSLDIRLNFYRGQPLSAIEQFELAVDGERVPDELILLEYDRNLYRPEELQLAFNEFWAVKKPLRALVYQGGLRPGDHEVDLTLILRSVSMQFGPGRWGMIDSSARRTLTLGGEA